MIDDRSDKEWLHLTSLYQNQMEVETNMMILFGGLSIPILVGKPVEIQRQPKEINRLVQKTIQTDQYRYNRDL